MKLIALPIQLLAVIAISIASAQDAAPPTVDLQAPKSSPSPAQPTPTPAPEVQTLAPPVEVPELSKLDEAFKQSSLGKAADEFRIRVEMRRLQNAIANDPDIVSAKAEAERSRTDWEKRERLREFYRLYYGRMRARASSEATRKAIEQERDAHMGRLSQPRVRPATDTGLPTPPPEKKHSKHSTGKLH